MTTTVTYAGQKLRTLHFEGKEDLERQDPAVFEKVRDSVFKEYDPMLASIAAKWSGTIIYGDVRFPHTEETKASCFEDIFEVLGEDYGKSLVFAGSLDVERGMMLPDRARVVVLGDLTTVGLCNVQCELWVEGTTTVAGGLYFDSNNGGYTKLKLAAPAGFIATSSNLFDIELRAKYYFDPIFRCGFGAAPTNRHEEIIQEAFRPGEPVTLVTVDDLADFFAKMNPEVGEEVRAGDHGSWLEVLLATLDSRSLVTFLDERHLPKEPMTDLRVETRDPLRRHMLEEFVGEEAAEALDDVLDELPNGAPVLAWTSDLRIEGDIRSDELLARCAGFERPAGTRPPDTNFTVFVRGKVEVTGTLTVVQYHDLYVRGDVRARNILSHTGNLLATGTVHADECIVFDSNEEGGVLHGASCEAALLCRFGHGGPDWAVANANEEREVWEGDSSKFVAIRDALRSLGVDAKYSGLRELIAAGRVAELLRALG